MIKQRYASIQVLRALAAIGVVAFHTEGNVTTYGWLSHIFPHVSRYGEIGVDIFFIISGFVIALVSYGQPRSVRAAAQFLAARVARVVPPYWGLTTLFAALLLIVPEAFGHARLHLWHLVSSFLFIPSVNWAGIIAPVINVGWTLNYEVWFYVVFALAMCLTRRPLLTVAGFLGATSLLHLAPGSGLAFHVYTNPIVLEFVAGACVGRYYARGGRISARMALVLLVAVLAFRACYAPTLSEDNRFLVFGPPALALLAGALALETRIHWHRLLVRIGDASYSLYLTHVMALPVLLKCLQHLDPAHRLMGDVACVLVVAAAIMIALACHHLVERPLTQRVAGSLRLPETRTAGKPAETRA